MDVTMAIIPKKHRIWFAVGGIIAAMVTAVLFWNTLREETHTLRFCMGEESRPEILKTLHDEAAKKHLILETSPGTRGEDSVQRVINGEQDVAIVFGGLEIEHPDIRQVTCLRGQPLHLLVKSEIAGEGLSALKGRRVNVGPANGETQVAVKKVLQHMGLKPCDDFVEEYHSLAQLAKMPDADLPDAIFASAGLPWTMGRTLVQSRGYKLLEIPFGEVLSLKSPVISNMTIPAHTYGYDPAVPERTIQTVGSYTMVIAHKDVPKKAIFHLIETLCDSEFPRRIGKPPLDAATMLRVRDYPLHPGATAYHNRNEPIVSHQALDRVMSYRNFFVSGLSMLVLLWGWLRRRPSLEYTEYTKEATRLEIEATRAFADGALTAESQMAILDKVFRVKLAALERHRDGQLPGDQPLNEFLARVDHVRESVAALPAKPAKRTTMPEAFAKWEAGTGVSRETPV